MVDGCFYWRVSGDVSMTISHGGQLTRVAKEYGIPESEWLDLSTGIAPFSYPIPEIQLEIWQDLPTIPESLIAVAKKYYQANYCWPLSGSQQLIEKLPTLWMQKQPLAKHVYLPKVGYKEHQIAWEKAGYQLHFYQAQLPTNIEKHSVVVVINPNNPLTDIFSVESLKSLQVECEKQQSLLIIDEAFADIFPAEFSFTPHINTEDVIVLRSFGKFFGLAGLRIGFACSGQYWNCVIKESVGPWAINGPALYIAEIALNDTKWQKKQTTRLQIQQKKQLQLIEDNLPVIRIKSNALFISVFLEDAPTIYDRLCKKAIYVRLTDEKNCLRFGIADDEQLEILTRLLHELIA